MPSLVWSTDLVVGAELRDHAVTLLHVLHQLLFLVESLVQFVKMATQLRLVVVVFLLCHALEMLQMLLL